MATTNPFLQQYAAPNSSDPLAIKDWFPRCWESQALFIGDPRQFLGHWFVHFRGAAILVELAILVLAGLRFPNALPLVTLLACQSVRAAGNLLLSIRLRSSRTIAMPTAALFLLGDMALLNTMISATGGAANPFVHLTLGHVAVAAAFLPTALLGDVMLFAVVSFAGLYHQGHVHALPLSGQVPSWSLSVTAALYTGGVMLAGIAVQRLAWLCRRSLRTMRTLQHQQLDCKRKAGVASLTASAAHGLASPLSTIAIAAGEMTRKMELLPDTLPARDAYRASATPSGEPIDAAQWREVCAACRDDATLIREEVMRCRHVLQQMAQQASHTLNVDPPTWIAPLELAKRAIEPLISRTRIELSIDQGVTLLLRVPLERLVQTLRALVENAVDAVRGLPVVRQIIRVHIGQVDQVCFFSVQDEGEGMSAAQCEQACEAGFSTKQHMFGSGLGLFLAKQIAEAEGGSLQLSSTPSQGTTAVLSLPLQPARLTY